MVPEWGLRASKLSLSGANPFASDGTYPEDWTPGAPSRPPGVFCGGC